MTTPTGFVALLFVTHTAVACSHAPPPKPATPPRIAAIPSTAVRAPAPIEAPSASGTPPHDGAIYFTFDAALIREDARPVLQQIARDLELHPTARVRIEGNCDERGTTEYNLALGDQRARAAKQYLMRLGIAESRVEVATYGSERPHNPAHDEGAWAQNRRDDFRVRSQ
jgi:peptidoglycan-associated lipoprotein